MGQTLDNGIYLPSEGERNCYDGLAANWTTLDSVVGGYRAHVANENIHITSEERSKWDTGVTQAYVLRYASVSLTALGTVAFSALDNTDNVKIGDKVLDSEGKLFALTAVDTANSTATLSALLIDLSKDSDLSNYYTKPETDTLLSNKANDSDVVHKSRNETISGTKTFSVSPYIYNSDSSASIPQISLKNQKVVKSSTTETGAQLIYFADKNNQGLGQIEVRVVSNGTTGLNFTAYGLDSNNQNISSGVQILRSPTTANFAPNADNAVTCGRSLAKWSDVQTYKVNGLEPSSLSLPSGNASDVIDISSYITDLSGGINEYTASVNGWITITCLGCTGIKFSITNFWANGSYRENPNQISCMIPICKSQKVGIYIYGSSPTIQAARFIPCQGNV